MRHLCVDIIAILRRAQNINSFSDTPRNGDDIIHNIYITILYDINYGHEEVLMVTITVQEILII